MTCLVAPELDAGHFLLLVVIDRFDAIHRRLEVLLAEDLVLVCAVVRDVAVDEHKQQVNANRDGLPPPPPPWW